MLGPMFIQVSVSDFAVHNSNPSTNIIKAFEEISLQVATQAGIKKDEIKGRNQIEIYLDEMYGSRHSAKIDPKTKKFVVTKNNVRVPGFCIVYIRVNNNYDKCCCNNIIVNMKWRQKREKKNEFNIFKILKIL